VTTPQNRFKTDNPGSRAIGNPPPLRVLALLPYPVDRVPGQRFRIEQWAPLMAHEDVEITFSPFLSPRAMDVLYQTGRTALKIVETLRGIARRVREARRPSAHDVAFVYREAAPFAPFRLERHLLRGLPWVLDFDDAIYVRPANQPSRWVGWLKDVGKTDALCRVASHVTVGNEFLSTHVSSITTEVTVVPTTIDTKTYLPVARNPNPRPVVGWSGSLTTLPYLLGLHETLLELRRRIDFEVRVIGGDVRLPGLDVTCVPWRARTEVEDLRALDVGLMPLPDDAWARGKCGLKALQYMALGIPPVVSPVGVNADIVRHGVDGFHAWTSRDWIEHLQRLIQDPDLRRRIGWEARLTVDARFSARRHAPRLAEVLRRASGR
jgi:glycosyltransferase involved in cell wall biosynthesis